MDGGSSSDRERDKPPEGGGGAGSGSGEPRVKRKMKTAAQLEVLERTYQVETYPSEALRAELSVQLNLSDRQLQMWFCHRRLKDRKMTNTTSTTPSSSSSKQRPKKVEGSLATATPPLPLPSSSTNLAPHEMDSCGIELGNNDHGSGSGSGSSPYRQHVDTRRGGIPRTGVAVPRISHGRYYDPPPHPTAEVRAIAYIEAQLGEPLREDGPALGVEFDPLPPGAFGAPIVASGARQKLPSRVYEHSLYERPDVKTSKGHGRALHEYQFLPEQPTVRGDAYERVPQSHYYGSPSDGLSGRATTSATRSVMHSAEDISGYGYQGQVPSLSLMPQQGKHSHLVPSAKEDFDGISRRTPYMGMSMGSPYSGHPTTGMDSAPTSEQHVLHDEEAVRVDRKRKSEEARLQKEVENHEKKMRRELEKQEMIRRKKEEQIQKEMEKLRKKEEERMLRERQKEAEKYQKEQKREMERREKLMRRESEKAEKLRQKEEQRKKKEEARQKAADDRAAARRIAKESMELIEDERLELMEIAASQKGLASILSLDSETLLNLELYRDLLSDFPPKSVQLKRPLAVEPWVVSEENMGNLLMVWRFLITFADVLGLWPFTLDEFIQAFHDYDPRVLGEIHVALLKLIIKDIEDAARTPSTGLGANQYSVSNPSGGHPHIVEGAYAWGFDIQSWQSHLGPLTWPEILRQFALSAGLGPKLNKRNIESAYLRDDNEGNDGMDVISNLRTGAAVENAVAIMQERGYSKPRKSRHRLTPGTVKFAAFHVLSLEGNNGLNILEVADRIQKSGLRDLTTSKTPEASIAAALSRDTKLFERVAPSTYCVKTPYRKDPADAEAILSAAREKIRIFKSGFVDGIEVEDVEKDDEDAEKEDDDVDKDEDSESDATEDPEVDDFGIELAPANEGNPSYDAERSLEGETHVANGAETDVCNVATTSSSLNWNGNGVGEDVPVWGSVQGLSDLNGPSVASLDQITGGISDETAGTSNQEDNDIDESSPGELWVQGLMEGEYSNLSVEERLSALVALFEVAMEGNSIRLVLEERLEAANALKKQMWAEAQLDKRKLKEENFMKPQYPSITGNTEASTASAAPENRQSPLAVCEEKGDDVCAEQLLDCDKLKSNPDMPLEKTANAEIICGQDNAVVQQSMYAAERSRTQMKSYIGYKAEEMYVYRSLPLGMDRRRNRYWQFNVSASSSDPGSGRIFVELRTGLWRLIDSEEAFDALVSSLDVRGAREAHLLSLLQKIEPLFKQTVMKRQATSTMKLKDETVKIERGASNPDDGEDSPNSSICASNAPETSSSSFQIECGKNKAELKGIVRRYTEFEEWMWKECVMSSRLRATKQGKKRGDQLLGICDPCHDLYFFEDTHCPSCHRTFSKSSDFSDHRAHCEGRPRLNPTESINGLGSIPTPPPRIRLLKTQLAVVEATLPAEALQPFWSDKFRKSWGIQLYRSCSVEELIQMVTVLEAAVNKEYLSANFPKTMELLGLSDTSRYSVGDALNLRAVKVLPWIPQTTAAVALRLMELDSSISYVLPQKEEPIKDVKSGESTKLSSKFTIVRNNNNNKGSEAMNPDHTEFTPDDIWNNPGSVSYNHNRSKSGRGKGGLRARPSPASNSGGRSQKKVSSRSRVPDASSRRSFATPSGNSERLGPVVLSGWKSRSARGQGGKKRSRRTTSQSGKKLAKKAEMGGTPTAGSRSRDNNFQRPVVFEQPSSHPVDEDREEEEEEEEEEWMGEEEPMQEIQQEEHEVDAVDENYSNNSLRSMEYEEEDNGQDAYVDDDDEYEVGGDDRYQRAYSGKAPLVDEEEASDDIVEEEDEEEEEDLVEFGGAADDYQGGYQHRGYTGGHAGGAYVRDDDSGGYFNAESSEDEDDDDDDGNDQYNIAHRGGNDQYNIAQRGVGSDQYNNIAQRGGGVDGGNWSGDRSGSGSGSTGYSD